MVTPTGNGAEAVGAQPGDVARYIGTLHNAKFLLIDVGAWGGISQMWRPIGPRLIGFGFDPSREICKINSRGNPVRYIAARILGPATRTQQHDLFSTYPEGRLYVESAVAAQNKTSEKDAARAGALDFVGGHTVPSPRAVPLQQLTLFMPRPVPDAFTIDEFAERERLEDIDFIKIDTDGTDFDVLRGTERSLSMRSVLGAQVEMQFAGSPAPLSNTFANIDIYMRQHGFTLFSLTEINRYARTALPGKFMHTFPSQGHFGQVLWTDAIYLRDVCRPQYFTHWPIRFGLRQLLNLLSLFDLYDLPDCGAELALSFADDLSRACLDVPRITELFAARASVIDATAETSLTASRL